MTYKPQFAVLLPVLLLATHRWRQLLAFAASASLFAALSAMVFGFGTWLAFLHHSSDALQVLSAGGFPYFKMPTVTASFLLLHAPAAAALGAQTVTALAVIVASIVVWRSPAPARLKAVITPSAVLLCPPYAYHYDLAMLAVSGAFFVMEARETGWMSGEKAALAAVWAGVLLFEPIAQKTGVQVGPLIVALPLLLVLRRLLAQRSDAPRPGEQQESAMAHQAELVVSQ
jgi:hypothetical protein